MTEPPSPRVWPHRAPSAGEEYSRMSIFDHYLHRYAATVQEELSLIEYLELCRTDPTSYATPAERMLHAIGEPALIDTRQDPSLSRIFSNKVLRIYPAFKDFYGM